MRITVDIDDELLRRAKKRADETQRTLAAVIDDALRLALVEQPPRRFQRRSKIPVTGTGGLQPGIDLDDMSSVLDHMEE